MRPIVILAVLVAVAFAQATPPRIPPGEAAKHLSKGSPPTYPQQAEMGRISGNVLLEVRIDESGAASVRRLIQGHPLLAPAAITAVNGWKYQPFEIDGKPTTVVTIVMITFGNTANSVANDRAEMAFQDDFWRAEDLAEAALVEGNYAQSEGLLNKAKDLLPPENNNMRHLAERWQWATTMGRLRLSQKNYEVSEQYLKEALALRQNKWEDKNSPEIAASLANLGELYFEEKKSDLAQDHLTRSLAIYEKDFKKAGSGNAGAQRAYGHAIARESLLLSKLAREHNDTSAAEMYCHTILDFQNYLSETDQKTIISACTTPTKP